MSKRILPLNPKNLFVVLLGLMAILTAESPYAQRPDPVDTLRRVGDIGTVELVRATWKKDTDPLAIADVVIRVMDWLETNSLNWEGPAILTTDLRVRDIKKGPSFQINPTKYPHIKIWIQNKDELSTIMVEKPGNGHATFGKPPNSEMLDLSFISPTPISRAESP